MLRMVSYSHRSKSGQITCYLNRTYLVLPIPHFGAIDPKTDRVYSLSEKPKKLSVVGATTDSFLP
jgi:hypothetical protein